MANVEGYTTQRVGSVCVEYWRRDGNVVIQSFNDGHCIVHKVTPNSDGSMQRNKRFKAREAAFEYANTL